MPGWNITKKGLPCAYQATELQPHMAISRLILLELKVHQLERTTWLQQQADENEGWRSEIRNIVGEASQQTKNVVEYINKSRKNYFPNFENASLTRPGIQ